MTVLRMAAQDEPEYRMELGAGAGLAAYEGDFNGNLLKGMQPMGMVVAKYKLNPRMAWAASLGFGQLKGSSDHAGTYYPGMEQPVDFETSLTDFSLRFEYNFWAFGTGHEYRGARKTTPFIALGTGLAFASPKGGSWVVAGQLQLGVGVKHKLAPRLNLAAEGTMHFSGSDRLDGIEHPYGIKSSDLFKNTDCYSTIQLTLTYEFMEKCKTCHNDKE
jgi:hypothetical protein